MRLGEEPTCRGQAGSPLTEKVVQDEPVEHVLLQASDHNVLGEELSVDPFQQHLRVPGPLLTWPLTWLAAALILERPLPTCQLLPVLRGQVKRHRL